MVGGVVAPLVSPVTATLYVGDLDDGVNEVHLSAAFSGCGNISSIRVCRDWRTGSSLRYAYVNFYSRSNAEKALKSLNHTPLLGKPMRIMWSLRNPILRKTGEANVFVKNLDPSVDGAKLEEMFGKYGTVLSCKVATDDGRSKGFGYVAKFVRKSMRQPPDFPKFSTLFIKNLDDDITDESLLERFSEFGEVRKAHVVRDGAGSSKGFGYLSFEWPEDSKKAIQAMNGTQFGSKTVYVGKALTRAEREKALTQGSEGSKNTKCSHLPSVLNSAIFVKNLHVSVDDQALREIFSGCGRIRSATVALDGKGVSRGFGFVGFSGPHEAAKAISTLNGAVYLGRRLYVAIAQRKEDLQRAMQLRFPKVKAPMVEGMRPQSQPPWMLKSYGLGCFQKNQAFLVQRYLLGLRTP
ncbi:unnamed protein product [Spirodela intermedia]|uniref:RRM domain-containing protein n=1 Tax=Spirodela intermedia TaxID=51605 RepID=A0A7I8ITH4_SPIIN|nr:unnamed protein product [Spirodela intermedia]CAA6660916.1 unnamed protein product [Spirodela intermedia]